MFRKYFVNHIGAGTGIGGLTMAQGHGQTGAFPTQEAA